MSLPVSDMICFSLYSATHAMQAAYKPLLDEIGLTYPQYLVLTALWQTDGQSVGQIGQTLQLESNTQPRG
jgi:MarR family transcriptional regulator, organic hydroperoxide resistance regulator